MQRVDILASAVVEVQDVEELLVRHFADDARDGIETCLTGRARPPVTRADLEVSVFERTDKERQPRPEARLLHALNELSHRRFHG